MTELWKPTRTSRLWKRGDPSGLPRNGLIALWDPYRDTYGRNVSVATTAGINKANMTESSGTFLETATTATHIIKVCGDISVAPHWESYKFTPVGRKRFMVGGAPGVVVDTETVSIVHSGADASGASIVANGDGSFTARVYRTAPYTPIFYTMPDDAADYNARIFAGDTSKGFTLHQWQVNLGPQLFPYSAPAGAPGTLQTSLDYSGNGNHLTLGATTGASTDDPAFTGTAWSFDGGDYLKAGDLSALGGFYGCHLIFTTAAAITKDTSAQTLLQTEFSPQVGGLFLGSATSAFANEIISLLGKETTDRYCVCYTSEGSIAAGTHLVSVYWTGAAYAIDLDGGTVSNATSGVPKIMTLSRVRLGAADTGSSIFAGCTVSINLAAIYTRPPSASERARAARYLKSLMTARGLTPSW